ncbi:excalibur calcium-binding domain-containing protein [Ureibacillus chungkukjangi]
MPGARTSFDNCTMLRQFYPSGVKSTHPAYASRHDRDNDGWAYEQ